MGTSTLPFNNYVAPSQILVKVDQAQQATALQGAIAQAKSKNRFVNAVLQETKLDGYSSKIIENRSLLGGLRLGSTSVTYGSAIIPMSRIVEMANNLLYGAPLAANSPPINAGTVGAGGALTGKLAMIASTFFTSLNGIEAYKCHLRNDIKGRNTYLLLAGVTSIPLFAKIFNHFKAAKITTKIQTTPRRNLEFNDKNPWPKFNGEAEHPTWGAVNRKIVKDLEGSLGTSHLGDVKRALKQCGMSDKDVTTFIKQAQKAGMVGVENSRSLKVRGLMTSYDAAKHFGVPFEKMFEHGILIEARYVYPTAERLAKQLFPLRRVVQTTAIQKLKQTTIQKPKS